MARNNQNVSYTPDAFDEPPEGPVGVHRGNPAWYAVILPYFVVIIIAVLAGLLVWAFGSGEISHLPLPWNHQNQTAQSSKANKKSDEEKTEDNESKSEDSKDADSNKKPESKKADNEDANNSESDSKADSKSQAAIDKSVTIKVINATNISGHAAKSADTLKQAGYANVTAGNPTGKVPSDSVVWYKDASQKAAAEDVAKTLGITAVENESEIVSQIVVILCK